MVTSCSPGTCPTMRSGWVSLPWGAEPGTPVVFEAAYGWGWLAELIDEMGFEPHLAHVRGCMAIAHARLKDDRLDARTVALRPSDGARHSPLRE
jgi:hypothetical protein